ncbi:MAG: AAA family ATPase [Nitrososphaerales archaeon]
MAGKTVPPPPTIALRLSRLLVTDFGPIHRADLDLSSDVTFLMGPQSAGKTYLTTLAYSLSRSASSFILNAFIGALASVFRDKGLVGAVSSEALEGVVASEGSNLGTRFEREPSARIIPNLLPANFGVAQPSQLVREGTDLANVGATFSMAGQPLLFASITIPRSGEVGVTVRAEPGAFQAYVRAAKPQITVMPAGGWAAQYGGLGVLPSKYIPAERIVPTQVLASYLDLILRMGQPSALGQTSGLRMPLFRQTLLDYIRDIGQSMASTPHGKRTLKLLDFGDLELEGSILRFRDRRRHALVDMSQAASGVAQVAGITLTAETEPVPDTLFVEEPELNLHADAQLRVSDYLAELSKRTRIILTTHSQYVPTMLTIALAKGKIASLRGYYLNPDNDEAEEVAIDRASGSIAIPRSIEAALERVGEEAASLDEE